MYQNISLFKYKAEVLQALDSKITLGYRSADVNVTRIKTALWTMKLGEFLKFVLINSFMLTKRKSSGPIFQLS